MDATALTISIIGAINWGLVGIFQFDLVAWDLCQRRAGLILGLFNKQIRESMLYLKINDELGIYKEG